MLLKKAKSTRVALISLILVTVISGCTDKPKEVTYTSKPIEKPELIVPSPNELKMKDVDFMVVNESNVESVFKQLATEGKPVVLFALDEDGYKNISLNMANILKYISQQKTVINSYKNYYKN